MVPQTRILRIKQVKDRVGLGSTRIYELIKEGSFPHPIAITERARGFVESEIEAWISARVRASRGSKDGDRNVSA